MAEPSFVDLVQLHERTWGTDSYPQRPSLSQLLESPIVALWVSSERQYQDKLLFSVYQHAQELETALSEILLVSKRTMFKHRQLSRIFYNQQPLDFKLRLVRDGETPEK